MSAKVHSRELLEKIYDILVKVGGAREGYRFSFIHAHLDEKFPCTEFRFCGHFGLGGKYRIVRNKIDYYREDETPERESKQAEVNEALKVFDEELGIIHHE